jgi:hypothetical protein
MEKTTAVSSTFANAKEVNQERGEGHSSVVHIRILSERKYGEIEPLRVSDLVLYITIMYM